MAREKRSKAGTSFPRPQQDLQLYVEGVSTGRKVIRLFVNDAERDSVDVNVFQWFGPLNVPEHGTYQYKVTAAPQGGKWVDPEGGAIAAGAGTSDVKIRWGEGPQVGKAVYHASENYIWDLGVNVVGITVEAPDASSFNAANRGIEGGVVANAILGDMKQVASGRLADGEHGLFWKAKVTLTGPGDNGNRGVAQMKVGFTQEVDVTALNTTYNGIAQSRVHGMQGNRYRDAVPQTPWYSSSNEATFFDPSPQKKTDIIFSDDSPGVSFPVLAKRNDPLERRVRRVNIIYDFDLYVSAQTEDTRNDAEKVTVNEALAEWRWDGSQGIGGGDDYDWDAGRSVVTPPQNWADLTDGTGPDEQRGLANQVISDANLWNTNWNV